jgi:uncharacterized protein (TIGR02246 family)
MKTPLFAVAGLAISFALPTFAQEQSAVNPETLQEIEAVRTQFVEAYNKHDAAAIAALYTLDAVRVEDWGDGDLLVGRDAIEKAFEKKFAASYPPITRKLVAIYPFEDRIAAISEYSVGSYHGHTTNIYVRDVDTWKIRMEFVTATQMPQ